MREHEDLRQMVSDARRSATGVETKYEGTPFFNSVSGPANLAARRLLYEAAQDPEAAFVTWPKGQEVADRWNTPSLASKYDDTLTKSFLTSARQHDETAKVQGANFNAPGRKPPPPPEPGFTWEGINGPPPNEPELPLEIVHQSHDWQRPIEPRELAPPPDPNTNTRRPFRFTANTPRPSDIEVHSRNPFASHNNPTNPSFEPWYMVQARAPQPDHPWAEPIETTNIGGFATRHEAEAALSSMQRAWDDFHAGRMKQEVVPQPTGDPAIYLTDKMRESIRANGFPLFVNPPTGALPSFLTPQMQYNAPQPQGGFAPMDRDFNDAYLAGNAT
jgi:hypothetical protein